MAPVSSSGLDLSLFEAWVSVSHVVIKSACISFGLGASLQSGGGGSSPSVYIPRLSISINLLFSCPLFLGLDSFVGPLF